VSEESCEQDFVRSAFRRWGLLVNDTYLDPAAGSGIEGVCRPLVAASFSEYAPPFDVVLAAQRMLDSVPANYLVRLSEIVLTNASALPRDRRRRNTRSRKRKVRIGDARGLYHPAWNREPAWIEVFVDNTLRGWGRTFLRIPWIREQQLGEVLFHEIGHHIHFTVRPEYREREDVADVWKLRLLRGYNRLRFPLIWRFGRIIRWLLGPIWSRLQRKVLRDYGLRRRSISRAEYDEAVGAKKHLE
jgi:hypothetical protein